MLLADFINKLNNKPEELSFSDTMSAVEANFDFSPTTFKNGETVNEAGQNSGSCKLFAFAQDQNLSVEETLACFGEYYRNDVLGNPEGDDHQNIRNFIKFGWEGIAFQGQALIKK